MKRFAVAVMLAFLLISFSQPYAQLARKAQIELFGGVAIPLAPQSFKDYFKMGYSIHGQYVLFPSPRLGIIVGFAYEPFTFDGDAFISDLESEWGMSLTGLEVEGQATISEVAFGIRPYLTSPEASTQLFIFGLGTYNLLQTEATVSYSDPYYGDYSETSKDDVNKFGLAAGAGMEIPAGTSFNIIIQGLTRFIFTEDETTSFIGVTAGLVF